MNGFLEVRIWEAGGKIGKRCMVPVRTITGILEDKDGTFIETGTDGKGKETGVVAVDKYETVRDKIQNL